MRMDVARCPCRRPLLIACLCFAAQAVPLKRKPQVPALQSAQAEHREPASKATQAAGELHHGRHEASSKAPLQGNRHRGVNDAVSLAQANEVQAFSANVDSNVSGIASVAGLPASVVTTARRIGKELLPGGLIGAALAKAKLLSTGARRSGVAQANSTPLSVGGLKAYGSGSIQVDPDFQDSVNSTTPPAGSAIWSHNATWYNISRWHPAGIVSNTNYGRIVWNDVSYISLRALLTLSCICWPAIVIGLIMMLTIVVGLCLTTRPSDESVEASQGTVQDELNSQLPVLRRERLTGFSNSLYKVWVWFCCCIPSIFVFGLPLLLIVLSLPYPQEVFSMLSLMTSMMMFSNGVWVVIFGGSSIIRMHYSMKTSYGDLNTEQNRSPNDVLHWVILPQYKEDVETTSMALKSIASSDIAKECIGIVLGMEQREQEAQWKAETLRSTFGDQFVDIVVTYHPADLPNDPPGKASNVAWAFKRLLEHIKGKPEQVQGQPTILTVADADSEFHQQYFEGLTHMYQEAEESRRNYLIWQSPVFHVKNYHRQPYPIIVGTMFTCMQELAALSDPHSIRFPYSTYSLTMDLAKSVGGWDPEWIAEDWHMGIKCFLMTMGKSCVEPLLLPCANYTPEDSTWWKTIMARWAQAKRHALGFSDVAYYFMMLPLVFGHALSKEGPTKGRIEAMRQMWYMIFSGLTLVIRLTNVHVIIGVLMSYGVLGLLLKLAMVTVFLEDRHVDFLIDKMHFNVAVLTFSSLTCMIVTTLLFNGIYELLKPRMEGKAFNSLWTHWCYTMVAFAIFGPVYFLALGVAVWKAAIQMLFRMTFDYEVAPKPTGKDGQIKS